MKQRALLERETTVLRTVNVGAGQIGRQQVGSKLNTLKLAFDSIGQRFDRAGLGQARRALDQDMSVGEATDNLIEDAEKVGDKAEEVGSDIAEGVEDAFDSDEESEQEATE